MSLQVPGPALLSADTVGTPAGSTPVGTSGITATQVAYGSGVNTIKGSSQLLFIESSALQFSTAVTGGIQLYNTADQVTNFERLELLWSGNVAIIRAASGGSGQTRGVALSSGSVGVTCSAGAALDLLTQGGGTALTNQARVRPTSASTITSGTYVQLAILPTYNQASGNAANTDLAIARTETAVGSGTQNFITCAAGAAGTTQIFAFSTTGILTKPGGAIPLITTSSAITDQAGAGLGTLTNAPTAGNPTKWVLINDNGTVRKLPTWT